MVEEGQMRGCIGLGIRIVDVIWDDMVVVPATSSGAQRLQNPRFQ